MNEVVETSYYPLYVALSLFCAFMGAYTALACVYRLLSYRKAHINSRLDKIMGNRTSVAPAPSAQTYYATLLIAGIAFGGLGVWAMHFVGTMALHMPVDVNYSISTTAISLLAAVGAAALGLGIVADNPNSPSRLMLAGAILGIGVSAMHYLGMYSMNFDGFFIWNWSLVALSCLIAFIAATAGLWLAFRTTSNSARIAAACVMGGAVCAMHYTGMAAADVVCRTNAQKMLDGAGAISMPQMPILLVMLVVVISFLLALDRMYTRQFRTE